MCGISGLAGSVDEIAGARPLATAMLDRLAHRGPDGHDLVELPGAWLGHRRLSIIDLAGGRQPITNEDETAWIVCNGEIYNYEPLRRDLIAKGHVFRTASDSEVVLHLFEEEGPACLQRLRGMFAFAIYDCRTRQLFCARDHLGQKPLFYCQKGHRFGFASEIKGLVPMLGDDVALNPQALAQYFSLRIIASPLSMFEGIQKLPPAHYLLFDADKGLRIQRWWDLSFEPKHKGDETALLDALEAKTIEAVKLHLVADVEVGAFLSGGLDSTLVAAIAAKHGGLERPLPTFTMGIPYGDYDEAPAARLVSDAYGTEHHEETVVPSLIDNLASLVACLDEPSDSLSVCSWLISEFTSKRVKVVLGGDGGDELFGGYDRYYGNVYAGWYALLPEPLRRHLIGPMLGMMPDGRWYKSKAHQLKWLHDSSFMAGGERYARTLGYFYVREGQRGDLFGPEMERTLHSFDPYAPIADAYSRADAEHPIDRMLYADGQIRLSDHSVMILDRTSMAHGLEARAPFMDHELATFCAGLPTSLKVRSRQLRYIQKLLAERYLPEGVLARKKQGFASALPYLLRDEYDRLFETFLRSSELAKLGYLRQDGIDAMRREHQAGRADHGNRLWLLVNAEAWYRMHIQGTESSDMSAMIEDHQAVAA